MQAYGNATNPPIGGGRLWGSVNFTLNGVEVNDPGNSGGVQNLPFGGTAVLIMIGVGLDTVKQIESQLMQRNYEGFLK